MMCDLCFLLDLSRRKESAVNNLTAANELVQNIALRHRIGKESMHLIHSMSYVE